MRIVILPWGFEAENTGPYPVVLTFGKHYYILTGYFTPHAVTLKDRK